MAGVVTVVVVTAALGAAAAAEYNVVGYGARPDGRTDSARAFLAAWAAACNDTGGGSSTAPVVRVPAGTFLCSAPAAVDSTAWIQFHYAHGLKIRGGTLDGRGEAFWACKAAGRQCPPGSTTLDISQSNNVSVRRLTLLNSKTAHLSVFDCAGVTLRGLRIVAPAGSPNTDGVHVQFSCGVRILGATVRTGDDCVSLGPGTSDVLVRNIRCGPGHGISIGSLGGEPGEVGVRNVTVDGAALAGTQNGLRIKTWGRPNRGHVAGVSFARVTMRGVRNPIVVDQNYSPGNLNCPGKSSAVKISGVEYTDVEGTSATPVAVRFDCSGSYPCTGIMLKNVNLTYQGEPAQTFCRNAHGSASGVVSPPSCLSS
ncbi:hypothetical protein C2845_PM17G04770 [Panicum miliaceum]|uniref:Polygalacturonase-like n=1 Tax=Panicum miliaceum TaxID=4540 RepID=A0A3L6Q074_PANMI|nr:hypothetical protein C2845_PM17G04770 [Panicum miliaceum]